MQLAKKSTLLLLVGITYFAQGTFLPSQAEAGPLMDWLFRRNTNRTTAYQQPYGTTCTQTCTRVVASYVPYTAYRTCQERVPVTVYRQTTSTDPCTGCTITCNRPCVTYRLQTRRVPYTAYRTVYRTETTTTPVSPTTAYSPTTNCSPCNTNACNPCNTCPGQSYTYSNVQPNTYSNVQPNTYSNVQPFQYNAPATYERMEPTPADAQPSLNPGEFQESTITQYAPVETEESVSNYPQYEDYPEHNERVETKKPESSSEKYIPPHNSSPSTNTDADLRRLEEEYQKWKKEQGVDLEPANGGVAADGKKASSRSRMIPRFHGSEYDAGKGRSASYVPTQRNFNYSPRLAHFRSSVPSRSTTNSNYTRSTYQPRNSNLNSGWTSGN